MSEPTDTEPDKSQSRRRILRSLVAGGGAITSSKMLPDTWTKPVVEAVLIPAHAQTSGPGPDRIQGVFRTPSRNMMVMNNSIDDSEQLLASANENADSATDNVLDFFISPADANELSNCSSTLDMVEQITFNVLGNTTMVLGRMDFSDQSTICSQATLTGSSFALMTFGNFACTNNVVSTADVTGMLEYDGGACTQGYSAPRDEDGEYSCTDTW